MSTIVPKRGRPREVGPKSVRDILSAEMANTLQRFAQKVIQRSRLASQCLEMSQSRLVANGYHQGSRLFGSRQFATCAQNQGMPDKFPGRLRAYFDSHREGDGIYKWNHYFEMYERHFAKFVNRDVKLCEIGVYSGGSLGMWRHYLGAGCLIYGVDIEPACKSYENEYVKIFIGDQADRVFWKKFREEVPSLDVVIDDGGHSVEQQIVTLEETLPYLRPGGVYVCEDIHGISNGFSHYVNGLSLNLNAAWDFQPNEDNNRAIAVTASSFQSAILSISLYPFAVVIERNDAPVAELIASKHGTSWQPFFKHARQE